MIRSLFENADKPREANTTRLLANKTARLPYGKSRNVSRFYCMQNFEKNYLMISP